RTSQGRMADPAGDHPLHDHRVDHGDRADRTHRRPRLVVQRVRLQAVRNVSPVDIDDTNIPDGIDELDGPAAADASAVLPVGPETDLDAADAPTDDAPAAEADAAGAADDADEAEV